MEHMLAWMHPPHFHGWNDDIVGYIIGGGSCDVLDEINAVAHRDSSASNLAFITYAVIVADLRPILILHGILFL